MEHHEREYFISRIRCGFHSLELGGKTIKIYPPTIEESLEVNTIYLETYNKCRENGVPTQDEMLEILISRGMWTEQDEKKYTGLPDDLDNMRVTIYESRFNKERKEKARRFLREGEKQYAEVSSKRYLFYENTCEGQAGTAKGKFHIESCTYMNNQLYTFEDVPIERVWMIYSSLHLDENQIRELARTEPWRSYWILNDSNTYTLFHNDGRQLNADQRNLLVWTKTYDNVSESPESPSEEVVNDDDALDGWFLVQKRKRDKEKMETEIDKHEHTRNADEVFVMVGSAKDAQKVDALNDAGVNKIKRERHAMIKQKGTVQQHEFRDERLKIITEHNQNFRGKFKNG